MRSETGVGDKDFLALFVGGDWERKGLKYAIEALSYARREGVHALLWVVGRGDIRRFELVAREAGVSDSVRFFGRQSATAPFFQAADVFVLPTLYETFSLVAYEAAATGLPVIATPVSGIDELLRENVGGLLVQRDAGEIGEALVALSNDEQLRAELGESGRRRAGEYTWDHAADCVRDLYLDILLQQPRRCAGS
jgi:UDP-glucose:(heptosyl)LPS alpha-1,3-glucosyltransferase